MGLLLGSRIDEERRAEQVKKNEGKNVPLAFDGWQVKLRGALFVISLALIVWAALVLVTGGFSTSLLGVRIASRSPIRPFVAGLFVLMFVVLAGWRQFDGALDRILPALRIAIVPAVVACCAAVFAFGVAFGTFAAGGSDSYGYVSQADLWLNGRLRVEQPFVQHMPWPDVDLSFAPLGYRPVGGSHTIVPTYPPGLPLLMAVAKQTAGANGPYYVVPALGALTVWLCYRLGERAVSPLVGAMAAVLLAASPIFLVQVIQPMSDIPAAAFWTGALLLSLGTSRRSSLAAGLSAAAAIAIRPNLAPLAAIPFLSLVFARRGWSGFLLGITPGVCLIAGLNTYLYGSPLVSGYGKLSDLYAVANGPTNIFRYGGWLLMGQTPLIVLAVVGLVRPARAATFLLGTFGVGVLAAYLFYSPFDSWWYTRFLLPALPALLILMASGSVSAIGRAPRGVQAIVLAYGVVLLLTYQINFAVSQGVLDIATGERRYVVAGHWAASATPPNAVLISMQHSGSLRHYGGRLTLRYDWLAPDWLDRALSTLRERGYKPFIVLDGWEVTEFRRRFGGESQTGRLLDQPIAQLTGGVTVYEPTLPAGSQ